MMGKKKLRKVVRLSFSYNISAFILGELLTGINVKKCDVDVERPEFGSFSKNAEI